jgi:hypothetical protein
VVFGGISYGMLNERLATVLCGKTVSIQITIQQYPSSNIYKPNPEVLSLSYDLLKTTAQINSVRFMTASTASTSSCTTSSTKLG